MSSVPPTPGPVPAGGVILGQQPKFVPPTTHKTEFHGCFMGLYVTLDENDVCTGYKLLIQDPRNAHSYEADFAQDIKDDWLKDLANFPDIGEVPKEILAQREKDAAAAVEGVVKDEESRASNGGE
jgi:hypothetical protein